MVVHSQRSKTAVGLFDKTAVSPVQNESKRSKTGRTRSTVQDVWRGGRYHRLKHESKMSPRRVRVDSFNRTSLTVQDGQDDPFQALLLGHFRRSKTGIGRSRFGYFGVISGYSCEYRKEGPRKKTATEKRSMEKRSTVNWSTRKKGPRK